MLDDLIFQKYPYVLGPHTSLTQYRYLKQFNIRYQQTPVHTRIPAVWQQAADKSYANNEVNKSLVWESYLHVQAIRFSFVVAFWITKLYHQKKWERILFSVQHLWGRGGSKANALGY